MKNYANFSFKCMIQQHLDIREKISDSNSSQSFSTMTKNKKRQPNRLVNWCKLCLTQIKLIVLNLMKCPLRFAKYNSFTWLNKTIKYFLAKTKQIDYLIMIISCGSNGLQIIKLTKMMKILNKI